MPHILIIDDEPAVASLMATTLERAGLRTQTATGLQRALLTIACQWPDLVLLDLTLGGERDGWNVWNSLAEVAAGRPLKVMVFAGELNQHDRAEAERRGAAGVLRKTSTPRQWVEGVRRALSP